MRRLSIGVAIAAEHVRAVALRGDRILWVAESTVGDSLDAAVIETLAGARRARWPRPGPRVTVALGPALAQTRRLTGLPAVADANLLARVVAETPNRFFLANGRQLDTTGVRVVEPGAVWASALDADTVRDVARVCRGAGLRAVRFVPSVVCLGHAIGDGRFDWIDGHTLVRIEAAGGVLRECVRRRAERTTNGEVVSSAGPRLVRPAAEDHGDDGGGEFAPIAALEKHGARFADAYGAATLPPAEPLVYAEGNAGGTASAVRRRIVPAAAAAVLGLGVAVGAPGMAAAFAARNAEARLRDIEDGRRRAQAVSDELATVNDALREVDTLHGRGLPALELLAALTHILPDSSALVSLRLDADGGNVVGVAPRAASIIDALSRSPFIVAPEVTGSVTRETIGDRELERVTVRFRIAGAGAAP